jgi:hypothetical protein
MKSVPSISAVKRTTTPGRLGYRRRPIAAGTSGGGCGTLSTMVTRSVRDPGDGLAHSSELDVVVRNAPDVAGPLGPRLADAALCSGEL